MLFDPLLTGLENVLGLRQQQHSLTASNLANASTPGYKAKQIDFSTVLRDAVMDRNAPMQSANRRHMQAHGLANPAIEELEAPPWAVDGNSVYAEREVAKLHQNALMYRSVTQGISRKLALLKYAGSDGKL